MKTLLFLLTLFVCSAAIGQSTSGPIMPNTSGNAFILHGKFLKPGEMVNILAVNPEAQAVMKKAKSNYTAAQIFGAVGGALIGFPIGTALGGGEPVWAMTGAGAGFIAISIPFSISYKKKANKAIELYNKGLKETKLQSPEISLGPTSNGFGLALIF